MNENDIREILEEKIKNAGYYTTEKPPQLYPQKAKAYSLLGEVRADLQRLLFFAMDRNDGWDDELSEKIKEIINKVSEHFS